MNALAPTRILGSALLLLMIASCRNAATPAAPAGGPGGGPAPALPVKVVILKSELLENRIQSTGTLLANEEVELRSEIAGRITEIAFQEGQTVGKGKVLVRINDRELQAQMQRSLLREKQLADDEARRKQLLELKSISEEEYEQSLNQLELARAETELLRSQLEKTLIEAPFTGKIGLRGVSEGSYVTPTAPIALLQQLDPIKIEFSVPEKYSSLLRPGSQVRFQLTGEEQSHMATVYAIESKIDATTRTLRVRARCANPGGKLTPGAFARIELTLERIPDAVMVPSEAIVPDLNSDKVFLMRGGKAAAATVQAGVRTDRRVQLVRGVSPGDTLITTGLLQLRPGAPVQVQEVLTIEE
jgi:membrane fusion protein (multidrug efflux system)